MKSDAACRAHGFLKQSKAASTGFSACTEEPSSRLLLAVSSTRSILAMCFSWHNNISNIISQLTDLEVALVSLEDGGAGDVVPLRQLPGRVIDGCLEVAVLCIYHQPHTGLCSQCSKHVSRYVGKKDPKDSC